MVRKIHYFGAPKNHKQFKNWLRFEAECGVWIEREDMYYITNNKKRVTCGNCLYLLKSHKEGKNDKSKKI